MKIDFTESVTKSVEIELPYYVKNGCHFFKLYSEKNCILVCDFNGYESIGVYPAGLVFSDGDENKSSNETEFREAYDRVSRTLKSK